jgi:hypothetical protein
MEPNYRVMYFSQENPDDRIQIFQCMEDIIPKDIRESPEFKTHVGELTCKPRFVIYLEGELKASVNGADYTKIEELLKRFIPSIEKE